MHWMKTIDSDGTVNFAVLNGYSMRKHLKRMGFRYEPGNKKWVCRISSDQTSRISQVENMLKSAEYGAQTSAQVVWRFAEHIAPLQPDKIILQVGINDLKTIPLFP